MKWMLGTRGRTAAFWTLFVAVYAGTLFFSVVPARADQASPNPFRELVKVVVTSGLFDVGLSRASNADTSAVRAQLEKQLGRPLSQAERERLQRLVSRVLLEIFPRSFWEDTYVDVLSKHVSVEDARELLGFYRTSLGQKTLRLAVTLAAEADDASQRILKARENEFRQRFVAEFQKEFPELNAGGYARQSPPVPPPYSASSFRYYCADSKLYYPYVQQCPSGWLKVVPNPNTAPPR